jgi:hypothetical protein
MGTAPGVKHDRQYPLCVSIIGIDEQQGQSETAPGPAFQFQSTVGENLMFQCKQHDQQLVLTSIGPEDKRITKVLVWADIHRRLPCYNKNVPVLCLGEVVVQTLQTETSTISGERLQYFTLLGN